MNHDDIYMCISILNFLKEKYGQLYSFFNGPALAVLAPSLANHYQQLIEKPRDLTLIRLKLDQGMYNNRQDFADDVMLCFANAKLFCKEYKEFKGVYDAAIAIGKHFTKKYEAEMKVRAKVSTKGAGGARSVALSHVAGSASSTGVDARQHVSGHTNTLIERVVKPLKVESGAAILMSPVQPNMDFYAIYMARIKEPMDFETVIKKLSPPLPKPVLTKKDRVSQGSPVQESAVQPVPYAYIDEFCLDMRRVFANAIRYNVHADKGSVSVRKNVTSIAVKFEQRFLDWNKKNFPTKPISPPLPEMRICLAALESAFRVKSSIPGALEGSPAVISFIDPIEIQLGSDLLAAYRDEISDPMDYGTIVSRVLRADTKISRYSQDQFLKDVSLVTQNCETYWSSRLSEGGSAYIEDARNLQRAVEAFMNSNNMDKPALMPELTTGSPPSANAGRGRNLKRESPSGPSLSLSLKRASHGGSGVPSALPVPKRVAKDLQHKQGVAVPMNVVGTEGFPKSYEPSELDKVNFYLPTSIPGGHESAHQLERRAKKYISTLILGILEVQLPKHFMIGPNGLKIWTCNPFMQKVDQRMFPEYGRFLRDENREEMCLQIIAQKMRRGAYGTSLMSVLLDVRRLRDNAHAFNIGDENIETRIMADSVLHYFTYLLKTCLLALLNFPDVPLKEYMMKAENLPILDERTSEDVLSFLTLRTEMAQEEHRKAAEEEEKKRAQLSMLVYDPVMNDESYEDGSFLEMPTGPNGEILGPDDFLDMDLDLSNYGASIPAPIYEYSNTGAGGKGKNAVYAPAHIKTDWELAATTVLNKVCHHPFVDINSRGTPSQVIADFFRPVSETYPQLAKEYEAVVTAPTDLSIVGDELNQGLFLDPEDFYEKLTRVFFNLVRYNEREGIAEPQKQYAQEMVVKGSHLAQWAKWLCLEYLPLKDKEMEAKHDKPELLGELRESVQKVERVTREQLLLPAPLMANLSDVKKFLANLKKTKGRQEAIYMGWFCVPPVQPSDYSVYVRRPMDLGTIQSKLEKKPAFASYRTYGEVIGDMRLVFQNSIKYNSVHMERDRGSKEVHDSAMEFLKKLEDLMPQFTLDAAERVERSRIIDSNYQRLELENQQRLLKEQQELALFEEREKAKRLEADKKYREDLDVERKKQKSKEEQKEYEAQQALLLGEMAEDGDKMAYDELLDSGGGGVVEATDEETERRRKVRLQGLGPGGVPPPHLINHIDAIAAVRAAVWKLSDSWSGNNAANAAYSTETSINSNSRSSNNESSSSADASQECASSRVGSVSAFCSPTGNVGWSRSLDNTPIEKVALTTSPVNESVQMGVHLRPMAVAQQRPKLVDLCEF